MRIANTDVYNAINYNNNNSNYNKGGSEVTNYKTYEEAVKASEATKDLKAESLLAKANSGQILSDSELEYIAKKCPDAYIKIKAAIEERKMLEEEMKRAKTKMQVMEAYVSALSQVKKSSEDGYAMSLRSNQLSNAYDKYVKTEEYKKKEDEDKETKKIQRKSKEKNEELQELIDKSNSKSSKREVVDTEESEDQEFISENEKVENLTEQKTSKEIEAYKNIKEMKSVDTKSVVMDTIV